MAAVKVITVRSVWTAFITALVAVLTSIGLTGAAAAVRRSAAQGPAGRELPEAGAVLGGRTDHPDHTDHTDRVDRVDREDLSGGTGARGRKGRPGRSGRPGLPDQRDHRRDRRDRRRARRDSGAGRQDRRGRSGRPTPVDREPSAAERKPSVPAQTTRWSPGSRTRSLPPTIKQRIRAEAHNASPSVRKLPALDPLALDSGAVSIGSRAAKGSASGADPSLLTTAA
ncbi:hypothetical protein GCM10010232_25290 [Streptomyces amakusaensis]|uniref:DUF6344 domain-containing protein n=1 Tax=Streptomyces amakusaensis TaxID=67271 RepID=A0ABW0ADX5_9ACTN